MTLGGGGVLGLMLVFTTSPGMLRRGLQLAMSLRQNYLFQGQSKDKYESFIDKWYQTARGRAAIKAIKQELIRKLFQKCDCLDGCGLSQDVVTDWSYALAGFLVSTLFLVFLPANPITHCKNVFLSDLQI